MPAVKTRLAKSMADWLRTRVGRGSALVTPNLSAADDTSWAAMFTFKWSSSAGLRTFWIAIQESHLGSAVWLCAGHKLTKLAISGSS